MQKSFHVIKAFYILWKCVLLSMSFWSDFTFWPESIIASFLKSFENFINERPSRGNAIEKKKNMVHVLKKWKLIRSHNEDSNFCILKYMHWNLNFKNLWYTNLKALWGPYFDDTMGIQIIFREENVLINL